MDSPPEKRKVVQDILEGARKLDSPIIKRSPLALIAEQAAPELPGPRATDIFLPPLILAWCLFILATFKHLDRQLMIVVMGITGCLCIWFLLAMQSKKSKFRKYTFSLEEALAELQELNNYIATYLRNLDQRTSKYFHCVTNTKVTAYFALIQMGNAMNKRVEDIAALLKRPSRENVLAAHESLQGTLVFTDGVIASAGNTHMIPLVRLNATITQLVETLESGLSELEAEINLFKHEHPEK